MKRIKGIDVSKWQGTKINWAKAKNDGIHFVFIRVGNRGLTTGQIEEDPTFRKNIEGALSVGLKVGVYFFSTSLNEREAVEEAQFVLNRISKYNITMPVVFDYEGFSKQGNRHYGISKNQITNNCQAFQSIIKANGYNCLLYGSRAYIAKKYDLNSLDDYLWVARYAGANSVIDDEKYFPSIDGYSDRIAIWQYANNGTVAGIFGKVDLNYMYIDVSNEALNKKETDEKKENVKMIKPLDYKQYDSKWGSLKYAVDGESSTIKSAGCGPTALANVLGAIVSPYIDPITCASWSRMKNYKVKNSGTSYNYPVAQAATYGVIVKRLNTSNVYKKTSNAVHQQALNELKKGNWLIACMGPGIWTSGGHFVVAYGYENGYVYINDPASARADRAKNTWTTFMSQVKYYWAVEVPTTIKSNGIVTSGVYKQNDFVRECQYILGAGLDGIAGKQTLGKTVTVSKTKNRKHKIVYVLQKKLQSLGKAVGKWDGIAGNAFDKALKSFQTWMENPDGEATAKGNTWKRILGL